MDVGDEEQEAEEDCPDLREGERIQGDPNGGESDRRQSRGRDEADPERRGRVCDNARESVEVKRKLKSCEVTDGCTIQVMSRLRGGGKHKDKKSKAEKKQVTSQKAVSNEGPAILDSEKEAIIRMWEENEGNRTFVQGISRDL